MSWFKSFLLIIASLVMANCQPRNIFESELWPGEGRPSFAPKSTILKLYSKPSLNCVVVETRVVKKGEKIPFKETRVRTIKPGKVKVVRTGVLKGRSLGKITYLSRKTYNHSKSTWKNYSFRKSDSFEYLQNRAEGSCLIRFKDEVLEIDWCPWLADSDDSTFTMISEPVIEWWINLAHGNDPDRWLLINDETVEFLPREF